MKRVCRVAIVPKRAAFGLGAVIRMKGHHDFAETIRSAATSWSPAQLLFCIGFRVVRERKV